MYEPTVVTDKSVISRNGDTTVPVSCKKFAKGEAVMLIVTVSPSGSYIVESASNQGYDV